MCKSTMIVEERFMDILEGTNNSFMFFMFQLGEFIMMIISQKNMYKKSNQVNIYNTKTFLRQIINSIWNETIGLVCTI